MIVVHCIDEFLKIYNKMLQQLQRFRQKLVKWRQSFQIDNRYWKVSQSLNNQNLAMDKKPTTKFSRKNRKCLVRGTFAGRIVTSSTPLKVSSRLRCRKSTGDGYDVDTSDSESQEESAGPEILNVHKKRQSTINPQKNRQSQSKLRIKGSLAEFFTTIKSYFN